MRKKVPNGIKAYIAISVVVISGYVGNSIRNTSFPSVLGESTRSTPLTEKNLCDASPKCQWSGTACDCAGGASPIPVKTYRWVEVKDANGEIREEDQVIPSEIISLKKDAMTAPIAHGESAATVTSQIPDQELMLKAPIEKRKVSVKRAAIHTESEGAKVTISGTALAESDVYVYLISKSIKSSTRSLLDSTWTYNFEEDLPEGNYSVYVAVINESGQLVRSTPFDFSISRAINSDTSRKFDITYQSAEKARLEVFDLAIKAGIVLLVVGIILKVTVLRKNEKSSKL